MNTSKTARFDTRWTVEEKEYFEYVTKLAGFKSLAEFVLFSLEQESKRIVEKYNQILATERDRRVFFETIENPREPNQALKKAYRNQKKFFTDEF
ncbi:MAG: DUF1778 domain-containing protein [Flexibacter sp. CG_4_10_14_3_um_filter_32_15]|nr:MAG: DUF1778 domain-containing protein [Flexibacter sp. CG_4_10_14_3_um_filter_32_15]